MDFDMGHYGVGYMGYEDYMGYESYHDYTD